MLHDVGDSSITISSRQHATADCEEKSEFHSGKIRTSSVAKCLLGTCTCRHFDVEDYLQCSDHISIRNRQNHEQLGSGLADEENAYSREVRGSSFEKRIRPLENHLAGAPPRYCYYLARAWLWTVPIQQQLRSSSFQICQQETVGHSHGAQTQIAVGG
jgi:hypothetical protein